MRMRQFFAKFLSRLDKKLKDIEEKTCETKPQEHPESVEEIKETTTKVDFKNPHKKSNKKNGKISDTKTSSVKSITTHSPKDIRDIRDIMELMEVPIVSLSKNRTTPITYESADGSAKVRVTPHMGHYLASIYDWDIVLFVSSKLQESMNNRSDIPPRTLIIPRHEFLKALCKHDGKKRKKI